MIKVLYFAQLREQLGIEEETIEESFENAQQLRKFLSSRSDFWNEIINDSTLSIAINQQLSNWSDHLSKNAEVAIFPPITGG